MAVRREVGGEMALVADKGRTAESVLCVFSRFSLSLRLWQEMIHARRGEVLFCRVVVCVLEANRVTSRGESDLAAGRAGFYVVAFMRWLILCQGKQTTTALSVSPVG